MSKELIELVQHIQNVDQSIEDQSLKTSLQAIFQSFLLKKKDDVDKIATKLFSHKIEESQFRHIYNIVNKIYDILILNNKEQLYQYNPSLIEQANSHFASQKNFDKRVIITTTTCKRTDLFRRTVNSFLECVLDWTEYVQEWIVIDDNSSDEDKKWMKDNYPFINYIYKDQSQKGHPRSMNMILDYLKSKNLDPSTTFILNLEDDWEFFKKDNYIGKMINILQIDSTLGQALVNVNYSEDTNSACSLWGASMKMAGDQRYFVHNFYQGMELEQKTRNAGYSNCFYWPHFSFRVGLTRLSVFDRLGHYDEKAQHFEMDYAFKYVKAGYKTGFLDGTYCGHIGRRTYERKTDKLNAYDLNNEQQFGEKPKTNKVQTIEAPPQPEQPPPSKANMEVGVYLMNLKRRFDRLVKFFENNKDEIFSLNIIEGFDGKTIPPSHKIQKAFKTGDYNYRKGIVGCAMTHIHIWKKMLNEPTQTYAIILEDDAKLTKNFKQKVLYLIDKYDSQFEILFLHYNPYPHSNRAELYSQTAQPRAERWSVERSMRENMGSGAGYIISRDGARNMLRCIEKVGIPNAIDWVMFKTGDFQRVMYSIPMIVNANCYQSVSGVDTDIQNVYDSLSYKGIEWDQDEVKYIAEKLLTSYHNESIKSETVDMLNKGFPEEEFKELTKSVKKMSVVKNTKRIFTIVFLEKLDLNFVRDYCCVVRIGEKENVLKMLKSLQVQWYQTDKYIYTIPDKFMTDKFMDDKVWRDTYLNVSCPF